MHRSARALAATCFCLPAVLLGAAAAQHVTTYEYDAQGRLTKADPPGNAKRSYSYDLVGNPQEATPGVLNRTPTANADSFDGSGDDATLPGSDEGDRGEGE